MEVLFIPYLSTLQGIPGLPRDFVENPENLKNNLLSKSGGT